MQLSELLIFTPSKVQLEKCVQSPLHSQAPQSQPPVELDEELELEELPSDSELSDNELLEELLSKQSNLNAVIELEPSHTTVPPTPESFLSSKVIIPAPMLCPIATNSVFASFL